ncbi:hypothetical protein L3i22_012410 [Actinoplanes sp. L3-i22]|nr:hypothetical protein L3i22_012410 [Actinoplanes sp. L3-i22]
MAGWRRCKISTAIDSEVDGAVFKLTVYVLWRRTAGELPERNLAEIHEAVVKSAGEALEMSSVLSLQSAELRVRAALSELQVKINANKVLVFFDSFLEADEYDIKIAWRSRQERRAVNAAAVNEMARLKFLRDEVFADSLLARIWWMQQRPELVSSIGNSVFLEAVTAATAREEADGYESEGLLEFLREFTQWLKSGDARADMTISLFDSLLATLREDDLRDSLQRGFSK